MMIKDDCGGVWLDWPHVITLFDDDGNERDYLPERTCKNISYPPEGFLCSVCGWGDFTEPSYSLRNASYCPHCGAKVLHDVTVPKLAGSITLENLQQSVSEPVENLHTARIEMCHGDHPPYPLFKGDAWTAWFACSECKGAVNFDNKYCKHCGAKLEPYERTESGE